MSIKLGKKFQLLISGSAAALPRSYLPSYLENKTINLQPRSRRKCQGFSREKKKEKRCCCVTVTVTVTVLGLR